jgi:hypothetical protein
MPSMKHRISNVLAWVGSPFLPWLSISLALSLLTQDKDYNLLAFVAVAYGFLIWLPSGIANYIMVGRFRLLPWKKIIEDS